MVREKNRTRVGATLVRPGKGPSRDVVGRRQRGGEVEREEACKSQLWPVTCAGILKDSQPSSSTAHKFLHRNLSLLTTHAASLSRLSDLDKSTNPVSLSYCHSFLFVHMAFN